MSLELSIKVKAEEVKKDDLRKDLKKYTMAYAKEYVRVGADELTKQAQTAMSMFYSDYDPMYYDRTYDLFSNSYSRYIHNNGNIYYGGVRISSDGMSPYHHGNGESVSASMIADMGWHGFHGPDIKTSSPLDYLSQILSSIESEAEARAEKVAESLSYSVIQFI